MTLSDIVNAAIDAIWLSFDSETIGRGIDILQQEADDGDAEADAVLAMAMIASPFHWNGSGVRVTYGTAIGHLRRAIKGGSALAAAMSVLANIDPKDIVDDPDTRFSSTQEIFDELAEYADTNASGLCLALTGIIAADPSLYYRFYPEQKDADAANTDVVPDYIHGALNDLERSCRAGFSAGLKAYGQLIDGPLAQESQRRDDYIRRIDRLAEAGNPEAMCLKAERMLANAEQDPDWEGWRNGIPHPDIEKAFDLYRRAVDAGDLKAMTKLAWAYYEMEMDPANTFNLFTRSEDRCEDAVLGAALCFFEGRGIAADMTEALRKARSAYSNTGDPRAAAILGTVYLNGTGEIPSDDETAFRYLHMVEDKFESLLLSPRAKGAIANALGTVYAFGRGATRDIEKGVGYLDRAIELGDDNAPASRRRFVKTIFGWKQKY